MAGAAVIAGLVLAAPLAYPDAPPPAHTGGFGEPTCRACHFDLPLNRPPGRVTIRGLAGGYIPGERYVLTVELVRPGAEAAGFQLSARFFSGAQTGRQAGRLAELDLAVAVVGAGDPAVTYAHQTRAGTAVAEGGRARWSIEWTAPATDLAAVIFHVAANAANRDASEFGDYIYSDSLIVDPRSEAS